MGLDPWTVRSGLAAGRDLLECAAWMASSAAPDSWRTYRCAEPADAGESRTFITKSRHPQYAHTASACCRWPACRSIASCWSTDCGGAVRLRWNEYAYATCGTEQWFC